MNRKTLSNKELRKIQYYELEILKEVDRICLKNDIIYSIAYGTMLGQVRHKGFIPWDDDIDIFMTRDNYNRFKEACKNELQSKFFYQSHDTDKEYFYLFDKIRLNGTVFKETFISQYNINHGVFLDIFPIDVMPNNKIFRICQYLKFHFYRTILESKYININARQGLKKIIARIIKFIFKPMSMKRIYYKCIEISTKYDNEKSDYARNFCFNFKHYKVMFKISEYLDVNRVKFENIDTYCVREYDKFLKKYYGNYMQLPPEEKRTTIHDLEELKL